MRLREIRHLRKLLEERPQLDGCGDSNWWGWMDRFSNMLSHVVAGDLPEDLDERAQVCTQLKALAERLGPHHSRPCQLEIVYLALLGLASLNAD